MKPPVFRMLLPVVALALVGCGAASPGASPSGGTSKPAAGVASGPAASPAASSAGGATAVASAKPAAAASSGASVAAKPAGSAGALVPVRVATILTASQAYVPSIMHDSGIDKKYGLDVQLVSMSNVNQSWISMRSGDIDVNSGSYLEVLRQRKGGLAVRSIRTLTTFGNQIVSNADKPFKKLSDLKGARLGTPATTNIDWLIIRAAGKKAESFDVDKDSQVVNSQPPLLNEQLKKGQLDAAVQFSPDFTLAPETDGSMKEITSVPKLIQEAGFDPQSFYLMYNLSDRFRTQHPEAVPKLVAAMSEAVNVLEKDDSVWPALAKVSGVTDQKLVPEYMKAQREQFKTTYSKDKFAPTQALFDAVRALVGDDALGVSGVDPQAFDLDSAEAAAKLQQG